MAWGPAGSLMETGSHGKSSRSNINTALTPLARHFQNRTDNMIWCIDMDKERGRTPRPGGKPNEFNVVVKKSGAVNLAALEGYVSGKIPFQNSVLEAISEFNLSIPSSQVCSFRTSFRGPSHA